MKKFVFSTQKNNILLAIGIILILLASFIYFKNEDKSVRTGKSQSLINTQLDFGEFTLKIRTDQLIDSDGKQIEVEKSKIIEKQLDEHVYEEGECTTVENIYTLWYQENLDDGTKGPNSFWWTSFTQGKQKFKNNKAKSAFLSYTANLEKLLVVKDGDLLKTSFGRFDVSDLNRCSGGWFYPVYKQEISNSNFDDVIYVEVNAGNGDGVALPNRYLLVKQGKSWLLFTERPGKGFPDMSEDFAKCTSQQGSLEEDVKCAAKAWDKYRSEDMIKEWTQEVLEQISW